MRLEGDQTFSLDYISRTGGWVILSASFASLFNAGKSIKNLGRES